MGFFIHLWNLVMLLVVTSLAVVVHSTEDMDVDSVTGNQTKPRGDDPGKNQSSTKSSSEDTKALKLSSEGSTGKFKITVHVSDVYYSGTVDWYYAVVSFKSKRQWGQALKIHPIGDLWSGYSYTFETEATHYGSSDQVAHVDVFKVYGGDDFLPEYIIIKGPGACDRYKCTWQKECVSETSEEPNYDDCFLYRFKIGRMPCEKVGGCRN